MASKRRPSTRSHLSRVVFLAAILALWTEFRCSAEEVPAEVRSDARSTEQILKIALILPENNSYPFSMQKVHLALSYTTEGDTFRSILPMVRFSIIANDSKCNTVTAPIAAINFLRFQEVLHAYFGPVCDYSLAPIARYSPYWNIPVITVGAMAHDFGFNKTDPEAEYHLLTRVGVTFECTARGIRALMNHYSWKTVKILYNQNHGVTPRFCYLCLSAILANFKQKKPIAVPYYQFEDETVDYGQMLTNEIGNNVAIILLCASHDATRMIMMKAAELNFLNGDYVFFNIDLFSSKAKLEKPWYRANDTEMNNTLAKKAYEALMTITLRRPDSQQFEEFSAEIKRRSMVLYGEDVYGNEEVNSFVGAFHDAVILYALAVNETIEAGINPSNGSAITKRMWNRTFLGITGEVSIDANGDRNGDYSILDMDPSTGIFQPVAHYYGSRKRYEPIPGRAIHWAGGRTSPPPDVPLCGFDGRNCAKEDPFPAYAIVTVVLGSLLIIVSVAAFIVYRHYKLEAELAEIHWRIRWEEIMFGVPEGKRLERTNSRLSLARRASFVSNMSSDTIAVQLSNLANKQIFTKTGSYKVDIFDSKTASMLVAIKKIQRPFATAKPLLMQIKQMRDLQNEHVARLIGVCIDPPNQCLVTEYCQKGSLQDVLENEHIKLDSVFKFSLIQDLVRGMSYLHGSEIRVHGNLKSPNCVVDSRFVLKLTDFGLHQLRVKDDVDQEDSYVYHRGCLWRAPELLRVPDPSIEGTQKGDVYSFAIICQEVIHRRGPFWVQNMEHLSPQEICKFVKNGKSPCFRPTLLDHTEYEDGCSEELASMIRRCWSEDPADRPESHYIKNCIKRLNKDAGGTLLDNLLSRMEQYAYNLESLVQERTADYLEQKKKAEDLLYMMLPRSVACQLMQGLTVKAEKYESVTIYFSDICGFTSMSAVSTPMQVVDLLNDLYTAFDSIIDQFDVYKVETIGDAYMVVSGLPVRNGLLHGREICRMALRLLKEVKSFKIRHRPEDKLHLRIGIHSGGVCAGVVGHKMPRYCLFGDTVNTASRMESNGEAWMIHVSPDTKEILDFFGTFKLDYRGAVTMKGKGEICTWWLMGEFHPDFPDLAPEDDDVTDTRT